MKKKAQPKEILIHEIVDEKIPLKKKKTNPGAAVSSFIKETQKKISLYLRKKNEERLTIMFIPHDERSVKNFHISNLKLGIIVGSVLFVIMVSSSFIINHNTTVVKVDKMKISQKDARVQFARIRREIQEMGDSFSQLRQGVEGLYALTEGEAAAQALFGQGGEELSSEIARMLELPPKQEAHDIPVEIYLLNRILNDIKLSEKPIRGLDAFLKKREKMIRNTPTLWPVTGSIINPYGTVRSAVDYRVIYNSGVDISTFPGAEVNSTAPGVVVGIFRKNETEWLVKVRHNYGYETVYSGLDRVTVSPNEKVVKGETLGFMGASQEETLLHYEIHIGIDAVNPEPYLSFVL